MILRMNNSALWTSDDIASYCKGSVLTPFESTGVTIDSRKVKEGDLFIAIKGPHFYGHQFVEDALDKGAAGAVVSQIPGNLSENAPLVKVDDTMTALWDLGKGARARAKGAGIIGVTGSVGKTGTKEMLYHVFNSHAPSFATEGNLNNHWGLPLSLARMPQDIGFGVFEMGMNHAGEIAPMSRLCEPDLSIITWIAPAHIENFDSMEGIALAKSEIFEGMKSSGIAILPRDNKYFPVLLAEARTKGIQNILTFGRHESADARLIDIKETPSGSHTEALILGDKISFNLRLPGPHHAQNALAVLLAAKKMGVDLELAKAILAHIKPVTGRGNLIDIPLGNSKVPLTLIDESYNASPDAMKAAMHVLGMKQPTEKGKRIAILGDMLELGEHGPQLHADLASSVSDEDIDLVLCCGPMMKHLADKLPAEKVFYAPTSKDLANKIKSYIGGGDVVMVKGSLGSKMALVVNAIKEMAQPDDNMKVGS